MNNVATDKNVGPLDNELSNLTPTNSSKITQKVIPSKIIVGYANWNQCDDRLIHAVKAGVNVLIWFSINLSRNKITGLPEITNGPDMDCVARIVKEMDDLKLPVIHLMSIGGWNSPHPDTLITPEIMYNTLHNWNRNIIARPALGFYGFDGFDWDIEGNDDPNSIYNHFTVECLDMMGKISVLAKSRGNYIISMAPAESYFDPTTSKFDRSLKHTYPEWSHLQPPFAYHGLNCYAYIYSKYYYYNKEETTATTTAMTTATTTANTGITFDFVTIQLYEGYSHAEYYITVKKESPKYYFEKLITPLKNGFSVDFSSDPEINYPSQVITVPPPQIVIGLANGWAGDGKFFFIEPEIIQEAYEYLHEKGLSPRGFAYWNIADEGKESPQKPGTPIWLAAGLNKFLHTRQQHN